MRNDQLFEERGIYPIVQTWMVENQLTNESLTEFCINQQSSPDREVRQKNVYLDPPIAAYMGLSFDPENRSTYQLNDALAGTALNSAKPTNLLSQTHPLQPLFSLLYKYPELLLLMGQHTSNVTQRIAYYTGYFLHFEMCMESYQSSSELSVETVQLKGSVLPVKSLIRTPLPRLVITAVLKSLMTHNGTFASWPQSYTYQPAKSQVKTCVIKDVLVSTCVLQEVKDFMQKCLRSVVQ